MEKKFFRPTDPNFLAYVTGNINIFWQGEETSQGKHGVRKKANGKKGHRKK
jgi:hypothetical protein